MKKVILVFEVALMMGLATRSPAQEVPRFEWLDAKPGKEEWVRYDFPQEAMFDSAEVFCFVNEGYSRGSKLPTSWTLEYQDGKEWTEVSPEGGRYPTTLGTTDRIKFAPVRTRSLWLKVRPSTGKVGLLEFCIGEKK